MDDPQHVATPRAPRPPAAHRWTRDSCRGGATIPRGWTAALRGWAAALAIAAAVGHQTASADDGPPPFPATVRVLADHTYLRAGPGPDYYPTERLAHGESVEIWAVDESGFCAVRPVAGSFSWVRASDLRLDDRPLGAVAPPGSEGVVIHDGALTRIGSQLNDLRHVAQVSLEAGERVRVLGRVTVAAGRHAGDWVKIAPPAGEFRFAARSDLESPPGMEPAAVPAAPAAAAALAEIRSARAATEAVAAQFREPLSAAPAADPPAPLGGMAEARRLLTGWLPRGSTVIDGTAPRAVSAPEAVATADDLADIDLALSLAVAGPTESWNLPAVRERLRLAAARSTQPADRLRIEAIDARLSRFEAIASRQRSLAEAPAAAAAPVRIGGMWSSLSALGSRPIRPGVLPGGVPADGQPTWTPNDVVESSGRLATVVSRRPDAPRFAIVDANDAVLSFVTPQPGVSLAPLVGQQVTVRGPRGFMPEYKRPYVVATEARPRLAAEPLEDGATRR
jgi:hypothetical protein